MFQSEGLEGLHYLFPFRKGWRSVPYSEGDKKGSIKAPFLCNLRVEQLLSWMPLRYIQVTQLGTLKQKQGSLSLILGPMSGSESQSHQRSIPTLNCSSAFFFYEHICLNKLNHIRTERRRRSVKRKTSTCVKMPTACQHYTAHQLVNKTINADFSGLTLDCEQLEMESVIRHIQTIIWAAKQKMGSEQ